jgi:soluble lytic murein transglycosylase
MFLPAVRRAVLLPIVCVLLIAGCGREDDELLPGEGDAPVQVADDAGPADARSFLATDRPWRAALVMRRHAERAEFSPEERLIAARAEAGWGAWPEVYELLRGQDELRDREEALGLYLVARALDELGRHPEAVQTYEEYLTYAPVGEETDIRRDAAQLRMALSRVSAGMEAGEAFEVAGRRLGAASRVLPLLRADAAAAGGDSEGVGRLVGGASGAFEVRRAWLARIRAAQVNEDHQQVRRLASQARNQVQGSQARSELFWIEGQAARELGDTAGARSAYRSAISAHTAGSFARLAVTALREGTMTPGDYLAAARVYRAQGLHEDSLEPFRRWLDSDEGTPAQRQAVRLEYADALFYAGRYNDVEPALGPIRDLTDAQMLQARAHAYGGNTDAAVEVYRRVASQRAGTGEAALALLLAGDVRQADGDYDEAREHFERLIALQPNHAHSGLAIMRLAGMAYLQGDYRAAAAFWERYRSRFPRGQLAQQATFWAGRAHEAAGDAATARSRYSAARSAARDSYYALLASERLGQPFWPIPMGQSPSDNAAAVERVRGWMHAIDVLREAGFDDEASREVDRIVSQAGSAAATLYPLAEALIVRGYGRRAIQIGLRLQGSQRQNPRLMRILYPLPFRTLIEAEAEEFELDPFVSAALIRQESLFEIHATSHVGARGLMQIMPETGSRLADEAGIDRWDPETLYHPEVNVHLGTRYVARHWRNYDGSLPAVFGAYNAGYHRVDLWTEYEEWGNDELFTERIPFRETRDYVKILTTNYAIYRGLYGTDSESGGSEVLAAQP